MPIQRLKITIRPVVFDDADIVGGFVFRLIDELSDGKGPDLSQTLAATKTVLNNNSVFGLLAYEQSAPIGLIMLNECAAIYAGGIFGEISELYVSPEMRSQGIAAELVAASLLLGREKGWKRLEVGAPAQPRWSRSFDFYRRSGFEEIGPRLRKIL